MSALPSGTKVLDAVIWGTSAWTKTVKIATELADGTVKTYFLKATSYLGEKMMQDEFNSLSELSSVILSYPQALRLGQVQDIRLILPNHGLPGT